MNERLAAFTSILDEEKVITVDVLLFISSSQALSHDWREPESLSPGLMGEGAKQRKMQNFDDTEKCVW